jgi:predicted nuclease with TOPRIM domain
MLMQFQASESPQLNSRIQALEEEMEEVKTQREKLEKKSERLEEALDLKDEEISSLSKCLDFCFVLFEDSLTQGH